MSCHHEVASCFFFFLPLHYFTLHRAALYIVILLFIYFLLRAEDIRVRAALSAPCTVHWGASKRGSYLKHLRPAAQEIASLYTSCQEGKNPHLRPNTCKCLSGLIFAIDVIVFVTSSAFSLSFGPTLNLHTGTHYQPRLFQWALGIIQGQHTQTRRHTHTPVAEPTFTSSHHLSRNQRADAVCQSTNSSTFRAIRAEGWFNGRSSQADVNRRGQWWVSSSPASSSSSLLLAWRWVSSTSFRLLAKKKKKKREKNKFRFFALHYPINLD